MKAVFAMCFSLGLLLTGACGSDNSGNADSEMVAVGSADAGLADARDYRLTTKDRNDIRKIENALYKIKGIKANQVSKRFHKACRDHSRCGVKWDNAYPETGRMKDFAKAVRFVRANFKPSAAASTFPTTRSQPLPLPSNRGCFRRLAMGGFLGGFGTVMACAAAIGELGANPLANIGCGSASVMTATGLSDTISYCRAANN